MSCVWTPPTPIEEKVQETQTTRAQGWVDDAGWKRVGKKGGKGGKEAWVQKQQMEPGLSRDDTGCSGGIPGPAVGRYIREEEVVDGTGTHQKQPAPADQRQEKPQSGSEVARGESGKERMLRQEITNNPPKQLGREYARKQQESQVGVGDMEVEAGQQKQQSGPEAARGKSGEKMTPVMREEITNNPPKQLEQECAWKKQGGQVGVGDMEVEVGLKGEGNSAHGEGLTEGSVPGGLPKDADPFHAAFDPEPMEVDPLPTRAMRRSSQGLPPSDGALLLEFEEMVDALLQEAAVDDQASSLSLLENRQLGGTLTSRKDSLFTKGAATTTRFYDVGDVGEEEEEEDAEEAIERMTRELEETMDRVHHLEQGLKNIDMEITSLQHALPEGVGSLERESDSDVRRLMHAFSSRERQVVKLAKTVEDSRARVSRLRAVVNGLGDREEKVKRELAAIKLVIPKLERDLLAVAKDTSEVEKAHEMKVVELRQRVEKIEKRGKAREERVTNALEGLKKQMKDLEEEIKMRKEHSAMLEAEVEAKHEVEAKAKSIRCVWEKLEEENKRLNDDIERAEQRLARLQPDMLRQLTMEGEQRIVAARQEQLELEYQIESLHDSRFDDVQEVMYLRWVNACMRHELTVHKWRPGDPEITVRRDSLGDGSPSSIDLDMDDHAINSLIVEEEDEGRAKATRGGGGGAGGSGERHPERERVDGRSGEKRRADGRRSQRFSEDAAEQGGAAVEDQGMVAAAADSREPQSSDGAAKRSPDKKDKPVKTGNAAGSVGSAGSLAKENKERKTRPVVKRLKIPAKGQDVDENDKQMMKGPSGAALENRVGGKTKDASDDRLKPRKLRPPPKPSERPGVGRPGSDPVDSAACNVPSSGAVGRPLPPPLAPPPPLPSLPQTGSEGASGPGLLLSVPPPPPIAGSNGMKRGLGMAQGHGMKDAAIQRAPEVVRLYQLLMKRGAGRDASTTTVQKGALQKGNPRGQLIEEMESRSAYLMAIKEDVETQAEFVNKLVEEIHNAEYAVIEDILLFVEWLDSELSYLVDERAVLKHFEWPEVKVDALREAAFGFRDLQRLEKDILDFDIDESLACETACKRIQSMLQKVESMVYGLLRARDMLIRRFQEFAIPTYWLLDSGMIGKVKRATLSLARLYMRRVSGELEGYEEDIQDDPSRQLLILEAVRFAFRVHQFAGGFDAESMEVFEELRCHANLSTRKVG
ncbi:hypothetical protein CBR_g17138 [Chara braunii]|uniref:Uncharacterized protein n=1 Tax=Chara braunii TaxID=69332 RepID=A0A388KUS8_CHABU|nr:hypothetical protein CBR_g17138 [Chara braunii]|eukprot:GBG73799.1 hypothetical protein CBR_g17138 [Chara braunii]